MLKVCCLEGGVCYGVSGELDVDVVHEVLTAGFGAADADGLVFFVAGGVECIVYLHVDPFL